MKASLCSRSRKGAGAGRGEERPLFALEFQQKFFAGKTAAVAGEFSVAADDAVAGDDDRDRIGSIGAKDALPGTLHA